jgi:hypothetical protein
MLIKFPLRRQVLQQLGLANASKQAALDKELREIETSIAGLRARRRTILHELQEEIRRIAAVSVLCAYAGADSIAQALPFDNFGPSSDDMAVMIFSITTL